MKTPLPDYLDRVIDQCRDHDDGEMADYIEELASVDPDRIGIAICTTDGAVYSAGDADLAFTIQSISKPFAYALALEQLGIEAVERKVDVEPSGEAFNEISLESGSGRPKNPMINAGAITVHGLIAGRDANARAGAVKALLESMAQRTLDYDEAVFESEVKMANRNLSIGYMLRSVGILEDDPADIVRGYIRQCAIEVTLKDLARMAAVLANGGIEPRTNTRVLGRHVVRHALSVMTSCGMYDTAGDWLSGVGIPAKSGVSGGIIGALPGQLGIAVFSPRIDGHGNSVRGVRMMERISADMGLHMMDAIHPARSSLRNHQTVDHDHANVFELQGDVHFAQGELLLRALQNEIDDRHPVVIDISRVYDINPVGRRMLLDAIDNLSGDGHWIGLVDPERILPEPLTREGLAPPLFDTLETALAAVDRR